AGGSFSPNANTRNATFTGAAYGLYVFQWTIANGECSNADQVRIENFEPPTAADAGDNQSLTCATTTTMAANDPLVGVGAWTLISHTAGSPVPTIVSPILYNTTITNLGPQSNGDPSEYVFKWTISNGVCTPTQDSVIITVYQTPTPAEAGADQELCDETQATLAATAPTVGTGKWTQVSPASPLATFTNDDLNNTTVTGLQNGITYVFKWTTSTEFCTSEDEVIIYNDQLPTIADAGSDISLCLYEPVILDANTPTIGTGLWTQTSGDAVVILYPDQPHTPVVGAFDGTFEFTWTITNGNCPPSSDPVTVIINEIPTQALAGPDQILCNISTATTSTQLAGNQPTSPVSGFWTVVSKPSGAADPTFADYTLYNTTISGLEPRGPGIYELSWTHTTGSSTCDKSDNMLISVYAQPTANAGVDQVVCNESEFTMSAVAADYGTGAWSRISGPNTPVITNPNSPTTTITGTVPGTYVYRWTIKNGATCDAVFDEVEILNRTALSTSGPDDITVCNGAEPTLTVTPSGGSGTYSYQWQVSDGDCNGTWYDISGATSQNYQTPILTTGTYYYRAVVTDLDNICGPVDSRCVVVTVANDPVITNSPSVIDICKGAINQDFSVTATGGTPSLQYSWEYNNGGSWGAVINSTPTGITYNTGTAGRLRISTDNSTTIVGTYQYRAIVSASGLDCNPATSGIYTLNVYNDPTVSTPSGTTMCSGNTHTMSVTASGSAPGTIALQWQTRTGTSGTWNNINGATNNTYTTPVLTATAPNATIRQYRVVVTQTQSGCSTNSSAATVTVNPIPSITSATSKSICDLANVNYDILSSVSNTTYTWTASLISGSVTGFNSCLSACGTQINDVLDNTGTTPAVVRYVITPTGPSPTNCVGSTFDFDVTVNPEPVVSASADQTFCSGGTSNIVLSTTVPGTTFYYATPVITPGGVGSVTGVSSRATPGNTYGITDVLVNTTAVIQTVTYKVYPIINGCVGSPITVNVTVNPVPKVTTGLSQNLCADASFNATASLTLTTTPTMAGTVTYSWVAPTLTGGMTYTDNGSATGAIIDDYYNNTSTVQTATYSVIPTAPAILGGCSGVAEDVVISVYPRPLINSDLAEDMCSGFPYIYTITSNVANSTFTWTRATVPGISNTAGSGSTATISETLINTTGSAIDVSYVLTPTGPEPEFCAGTASTLVVTVFPDPFITAQPSSITICSGGNTPLTVTAGGGTPSLDYQWEISTIPSPYSWSPVVNGSGGTTNAYTTANLTQTTYYRVTVSATGNGCNPVTSDVVAVHIPHITTQPLGETICVGGTHTMNVAADDDGGSVSSYSYQWQVSAVDCYAGYFDITGANTSSYTTPTLNVDRYYRVIITTATPSCTIYSECAPVYVVPDPTITLQPSGATICTGGTHTMNVIAAGGTGTYTYQWQSSASVGGPYADVVGGSGAMSDTYTTDALTSNTYFRVVVSDAGSGCASVNSNPALITVNQQATAYAGINNTICSSETFQLSGNATNYTSLMWTTSGTGAFNNPISLNPIYTPSAADITAGTVNLTLNAFSASPCVTATSTLTLVIDTEPTTADAGTAQVFCGDATPSTVTMAANTPVSGTGAWSLVSSTTNSLTPNITTPSSPTTTITNLGFGTVLTDVTYTFRWTISNGVCTDSWSEVDITLEKCCPITFNENITVCAESTANLIDVSNGENSPGGFNLTLNTTPIEGPANGGTFTYTSGTTFSYTPGSGFTGTDRVIVEWCDDATPSCCTNDTIFIVVSPVANAGADQTLCDNSYAALTGNVVPGATVLWTQVSGPSAILYLPTNSSTIAFNMNLPGAYVFQYTVTNGACVTSDQVTVTKQNPPSLPFAGIDQELCSTSNSTILTGNTPTYGTGTWIQVDGPSAATIPAGNPATVTDLTTGTYTFAWEITNGDCAPVRDLVSVTLYDPCDVDAGDDATICEGSTFTLNPTTATNCGTLGWGTNGDGYFDNALLQEPTYTPGPQDIIDGSVVLFIDCASCCEIPCPPDHDEMELTIIKEPVANAGPDATICSGTAFQLSDATAIDAVDIAWSSSSGDGTFAPDAITLNASYTPSAADILAGSVTLTLTANNSTCSSSTADEMDLTITSVTAVASVISNVSCYGEADGSAKVTPGSGAAPYTYLWNNGMTNPSIDGLVAGNYSVTVTDNNGCVQTSNTVTITQPVEIILTAPVVTNASCAGGQTGSVQLAVTSGGTSPFTFALSTGESNATGLFTLLSAGGYTYTVTDANGCMATGAFEVTDPNLLTMSVTGKTDETCNESNNGTATVTATGGTSPYSFAWTGSVTQASTTDNPNTVTGLAAGIYIVTVTDNLGCTAIQTIEITEPAELNIVLVSQDNVLCNGGSTGAIVVDATGGVAPYAYTSTGGITFVGNTATGVIAGTYTVTVTDANSCTEDLDVTITQPAAALAASTTVNANVLCYGDATGQATVNPAGGTEPYTYLWANGSTDKTATNLAAGTYTVDVLDANGCATSTSALITEPSTAVTATITASTNPSCEGNTTGTATVEAAGGTPGVSPNEYTYLWSNGDNTATATGLTAGNYTVTVTDANGCTAEASVLLVDPTGITATITGVTHLDCNGDDDGEATVTASGGSGSYTFVWTGGSVTQASTTANPNEVTGLAPGFYTVTVTDGNSCTATAFVEITEPAELDIFLVSQEDVDCNGASTGSMVIDATGGLAPYTFTSVPAITFSGNTATGLSADSYAITVTDANLCTDNITVVITEPALALSATTTVNANVLCYGDATGQATVNPAGGTEPYTYLWANGSTDKTAT
ncbi:MAG: PKD-like domain-containing protein, partial [Pseudomonas sp.]|nr:PKD-like domain-containing protein [Pseudomonas sp.]